MTGQLSFVDDAPVEPALQLRPYQKAACDAIEDKFGQFKRVLLVLPTGTGKTICFAQITKNAVKNGQRVLILAHREELLQQAADKLEATTGLTAAFEKASRSCLGRPERVVIGSVQTMHGNRLDAFPGDYFDLIIVDEAHHSLSPTYRAILDHFPNARVLGVTATPDRGDKKALAEVFEDIAYEYPLHQAIDDGWLCPIKVHRIPLKLDISKVAISQGDYASGGLGSALDPYLQQIAIELKKLVRGHHTVIFLPLIRTSLALKDYLCDLGIKAEEVNGQSDDRKEKLARFERGETEVLCNSMLLTEGWDCPSVDTIVILRPTQIRPLYAQMVGRGTRLAPGKKALTIIDFLWISAKHELCTPASLVAKDDEIKRRMESKFGFGEDVFLDDAERESERDAKADRERKLLEELERNKEREARIINPLELELSIHEEDCAEYQRQYLWQEAEPTEKQIEFLKKNGFDIDKVEDRGHACKLTDITMKRMARHLATPKQVRFLEKKGFEHASLWTFDQAHHMMDLIVENRWQVPYYIDPSTYDPKKEKIPC